MMLFFFIIGALIEKYKPRYGHETCLTIILGVTLSCILWASKPFIPCDSSTQVDCPPEVFAFKSGFFFDFFLPPIVFNAGFNMRKKKFFANLGNVALLGLIVTLVCFSIYAVVTILIVKNINLWQYNYYFINHPDASPAPAANSIVIAPNIMQILLFCALLCSSDVVSAVSIIDYN